MPTCYKDGYKVNNNNMKKYSLVVLSEELAYTLNLSKEETSYLATKYKPQVNLTSESLQVGASYCVGFYRIQMLKQGSLNDRQ